ALAVGQADRHIVVGVAGFGAEELHLRVNDLVLVGVDGVVQAGDVGRTGAHVDDALLVGADHAAAGAAQNAHVQAADVGGVAADDGVVDGRAAVLDHADVGGGAADFEVDAVGGAQIHQAAHDRGGRAGQHGQHRALLHLIDLHNAAVAAHDHQRHGDARLPHRSLGGVGGVQHLWQDG